jgi:ABC-type transport system involved in multi-copper enzyme maturation permease subunit
MTTAYGFRTVSRMEWIKLRSLRSAWWLLAASVLAMVAMGAGVGLGYRDHTPVATAAQIVDNSLGGAILAQLFLGALGILVVTGEYSSGTIRATLSAVPRRPLVLAAKIRVYGVAALLTGLLASAAGFVAGQIAIAGTPIPSAPLTEPTYLIPLVLTGVYLGAAGLLGLGLGAVIRHSGAAICVLFGGLFVTMILASVVGPGGLPVSRFVPVLMLLNSIAVTTPVPGMLPAWAATAAMAGYAAVALGLGTVALTRRDA